MTPISRTLGDQVAELSLAQIKTLNCGFVQLPGYPEGDVIEGNRIAELKEVHQLVRGAGSAKVRFNVEAEVESSEVGRRRHRVPHPRCGAGEPGDRDGRPDHPAVLRLLRAEPHQGDRARTSTGGALQQRRLDGRRPAPTWAASA